MRRRLRAAESAFSASAAAASRDWSGDCVMSNKMWGGRFSSGPDAVMEEINASIDFDRHLYRQDIAASKAHAAMLVKQGIITAEDATRIQGGLDTILSE